MANIINKEDMNSKSTESKHVEPVVANQTVKEQSDIKTEPKEDNSKSVVEQPKKGMVVLRFVGNAIWRDSENKLWASSDLSDGILNSRQMSKDEYDKRDDLKFMVGYGEMKAEFV